MATNEIVLSIIVTIVGGRAFLRKCLNHLLPQIKDRPIEVIVPYDSTVDGIDQIEKDFPRITFINMGVIKTDAHPGTQAAVHEIYDLCTAKGLNVGRGEVLALLQDTGAPDPDWCDQVLEAHCLPYGVIGGAVEHKGRGVLNWAVYFLDFGRHQLPLREGPVNYLTDVNVSYKRDDLESVKELWVDRYKEVTVNWELNRRGVILWQRPQIVVRQDRGELLFSDLIVERYSWGRLFGSLRTREISLMCRLLYVICSPGIPAVLLSRMARKVFLGRRNRAHFIKSLPQILVMTLAWSLGELIGYVTGRESA